MLAKLPAPRTALSRPLIAEPAPQNYRAGAAAYEARSLRSTAIENSVYQARWILVPLFALWVTVIAVGVVLS